LLFVIGSPKSIEDLSGSELPHFDIRQLRRSIKILVIDDVSFAHLNLLKDKYDYNITLVNDLDQVSFANGYDIVLCDIHGVGKAIGGTSGGDLITELRKAYPLKTIVAFTGHAFKADYNRYYSLADDVLDKDIELADWVEKLDTYAKKLMDPVLQWRRAREFLLESHVRTAVVLKLEHQFVSSFANRKKLELWKDSSLVKKLQPHAIAIIHGVAGNLATRFLFGG
jgi:hypothetical protein